MNERAKLESELREWLRTHDGVIGRAEALKLGASLDLIRAKLERREWATVYCGVYRDTASPASAHQALRAAYVATGSGVVSHCSAGWLWDLLEAAPASPELTVRPEPGQRRHIKGITIHRSKDLDPAGTSLLQGFRVTNPLRTIVDLAGVLPLADLTKVVDVVLARRLVTVDGLVAELGRRARRGRSGVGKLRCHLVERGLIGAPAASVLEAKMLRIIIGTGLPLPARELHVVDGLYRLDFAWPSIRLAVEVDGYVWHSTAEQKRRDDARRNRLQREGWTVLVYNWKDVCDEPGRLANELVTTYSELERRGSA